MTLQWESVHRDTPANEPQSQLYVPVDCFLASPLKHRENRRRAGRREVGDRVERAKVRKSVPFPTLLYLFFSFYTQNRKSRQFGSICPHLLLCLCIALGGAVIANLGRCREVFDACQASYTKWMVPILYSPVTPNSPESTTAQDLATRELATTVQDLETRVLDLVNRRLEEYTKSLDNLAQDRILELDLSQRAFGATIITSLSSRTTLKQSATPLWSSLPFSMQRRPVEITSKIPAIVLESQLMLGDCWEFQGSQGHLAIRLPRPSKLTALSIHYFPFHELSPQGQLQAPRTIVLWGLVRSPKAELVSRFPESRQPSGAFLRRGHVLPDGIEPGDVFVPVANATFNVKLSLRKQIVDFENAAHFLFDVIVVEVKDNWGGDSTCMYHVGVHGRTSSDKLST